MNRLPDERDMDQVVRSWMREEDEHPADRNRQIGRIMGRTDETHQRRGAWRFLPFGRGSRHVDQDDEELYVAGGGAVRMRKGVSAAVAVAAVAMLLVMGVAFLAVVPRTFAPGGGPTPTPLPTVHPDDAQAMTAFVGLFSGEPPTLDEAREVYAEDAVHTVLWHDRIQRFNGPHQIWRQIVDRPSMEPSVWIPVQGDPGLTPPERRYITVTDELGGIACVGAVQEGRITRHDCIMPMMSTGTIPEWDETPADTLEVREQLWVEFIPGWANGDRDLIDATVSESIVHHVAFEGGDSVHSGKRDYMSVMGRGSPKDLADPIALPAPKGQYRWTDYNDIAGGTLCTFWAREGKLVRHDCIVPA